MSAQWQAAIGAGLQSAGDAVYNYYGMKRKRELEDQDAAERAEKLALDRSLTESQIQRNMEELGFRGRELSLEEKEQEARRRHEREMQGLTLMEMDRGALESDRAFTEGTRQFNVRDARERASDALQGEYWRGQIANGKDSKETDQRTRAYAAVVRSIDNMVDSAIQAMGQNKLALLTEQGGPMAGRRYAMEELRKDPNFRKLEAAANEMLLGLGGVDPETAATIKALGSGGEGGVGGVGAPTAGGLSPQDSAALEYLKKLIPGGG